MEKGLHVRVAETYVNINWKWLIYNRNGRNVKSQEITVFNRKNHGYNRKLKTSNSEKRIIEHYGRKW